MKIVSIWNPKGGQGKSLLALNLAACAVKELNIIPLVIDQDRQGTCTMCFDQGNGNLPFKVVGEIPKSEPKGVDLVIIDHQASEWVLPPSETVIMPVLPERTQFETYARAYEIAKGEGKKIITVVTNVKISRKGERMVADTLVKEGALFLGASAAFVHASAALTTIFDDNIIAIKNSYNLAERRAEVKKILTSIMRSKKK